VSDRLETDCDQVEPDDESRSMPSRRTTIVPVCVVLLAAALYEAAVALRLVSMGKLPGTEPAGGVWVFRLAMLALVAGIALSLLALRREAVPQRLQVLLAPSALAFVIARYYTFDPYYLPTLRRMSTGCEGRLDDCVGCGDSARPPLPGRVGKLPRTTSLV
jgi:hypothetical protein